MLNCVCLCEVCQIVCERHLVAVSCQSSFPAGWRWQMSVLRGMSHLKAINSQFHMTKLRKNKQLNINLCINLIFSVIYASCCNMYSMPPHLHVCSFSYIQWNSAEKNSIEYSCGLLSLQCYFVLHGQCEQTVAPIGFIPATCSCNNSSVFLRARPQ